MGSKIPDIGAVPVLPRFGMNPDRWRDGLLIRTPNWLGDAVMTLPAMLQLRKLVPNDCGLFVLCPPGLKDFFESLPIVDVTVPLHSAHSAWSRADRQSVRNLTAGACLMFNNSLRDTIYLRLAYLPMIFGSSRRMRSLLLTKAWQLQHVKRGALNKMHHAARYLAMAYALGAPEWDGTMPAFAPFCEVETMAPSLTAALKLGANLMAIAPGAAYGEAKRWPSEYFNAAARLWIERGGTIAILGAKSEMAVAESVMKDLPQNAAFNLCGKTNMKELIMLLEKAKICIANDSGTMHLAAATGTPGVAIFGSTDPSSTSPLSVNWKILYERQNCSPCFRRECQLDNDKYRCLRVISPEMVMESANEVLRRFSS
ncbi:MAG: lipopolysaccharide heptosyltransferase II [Lentisphaerae bacterium GWF2_45_14]|nr:MAG: lipopolysaccharide heptosyltransferase II [Lentisphaerae bacterium GWF2_45_14]